jgi:hypothetical protein
MVDYVTDVKDLRKRKPFSPIFWILPLIFSALVILILVVVQSVAKHGTWGSVFWWSFFALFVCWGVSILIYLLTSIQDLKSKEREFNSPQRCDELLRDYLLKDTGYVVDDFSRTAESVYGSRWAGEGDVAEQERVYFHLYRFRVGALSRYLLAVINMDKSKSDSYIFKQSPSNFQNIGREVDDLADQLCSRRKRMVTRRQTFKDNVSGREEVTEEESPLDATEDGLEDVNDER